MRTYIFWTLVQIVLSLTAIECNNLFRLTRNVVPDNYNLTIEPNFDEDTFKGNTTIEFRVLQDQDNITLNSADLHITKITLNGTLVEYIVDQDQKLLIIRKPLLEVFKIDNYVLNVEYEGKITLQWQKGISRTTLEDNANVYVTDFEPTGAQYMFPCFDEPFFKAHFTVILIVANDSKMSPISNTPEETVLVTQNSTVHKFAKTWKMPTYLLCIIFTDSNFTSQEIVIDNKPIQVRIYSNRPNSNIFNYVKSSLEYYTQYTNFTQPLQKIDFIDYAKKVSGTENWGLITLRSSFLSSGDLVYDVESVLKHELGHFWIGNLVTNDWWDDLWLHEGLVSAISDSNSYQDRQGINELQGPVIKAVEKEQDFDYMFSDITYKKGAGIFHMIQYQDPNLFQTVIRQYVHKYQYKTATTEKLVQLFEENDPNLPWRDLIESFTKQNNTAQILISKEKDNFVLKLECLAVNLTKCDNRWTFPIKYSTELNSNDSTLWFTKDVDTLTVPSNGAQLIILNQQQYGYYRFNYTAELWKVVKETLPKLTKAQTRAIFVELDLLYGGNFLHCSKLFSYWEKGNSGYIYRIRFFTDMMSIGDPVAQKALNKYFRKFHLKRTNHSRQMNFYPDPNEKLPKRVETCVDWLKHGFEQFLEKYYPENLPTSVKKVGVPKVAQSTESAENTTNLPEDIQSTDSTAHSTVIPEIVQTTEGTITTTNIPEVVQSTDSTANTVISEVQSTESSENIEETPEVIPATDSTSTVISKIVPTTESTVKTTNLPEVVQSTDSIANTVVPEVVPSAESTVNKEDLPEVILKNSLNVK